MLMTTPPSAAPAPQTSRTSRRVIAVVLGATAALAIAVPAVIVGTADRRPAIVRKLRLAPTKVVPQSQVPLVEPLAYAPVTREDAVAFNATIPFSTAPNPAARPFKLADTPPALDRAIDCLAAAQLYEAGDDPEGERAVAQVVINRVRHPAFPKTICGVVFEGSERTTGCQFTFACDGALARHRYSEPAWATARFIARAALSGAVYRPVGHATHYHTDWVVPYWSASLDKVTAIKTHLFFRWTGWWGTPAAFNRTIDGNEPLIAKLAAVSPAHAAAGTTLAGEALPPGVTGPVAPTQRPYPEVPKYPDTFIVTLDRAFPADELPALAAFNCGNRDYCKFMVWTDPKQTAGGIPLAPEEIASMSFSYFRDRATGYDKPLWNCGVFARREPSQCMRRQLIASEPATKVEPVSPPHPTGASAPPAKRQSGTLQAPHPAGTPTP